MNLSAFLYAILAALTGLSLGAGAVEEPRVAECSLSVQSAAIQRVVGIVVRAARAPLSLRQAPVAPRTIGGIALALVRTPIEALPSRRRE